MDAKTLQNKARQAAVSRAMWAREGHRENHVAKLSGRKMPETSKRMKGENNPMYGKVSPNRDKEMPQISEKIKGKKKPDGFGEKISKARKGKPNLAALGKERPEHSELMKDPARNKGSAAMKEMHTCVHCGKTANLPNYTRWHGDKCKLKGFQYEC